MHTLVEDACALTLKNNLTYSKIKNPELTSTCGKRPSRIRCSSCTSSVLSTISSSLYSSYTVRHAVPRSFLFHTTPIPEHTAL